MNRPRAPLRSIASTSGALLIIAATISAAALAAHASPAAAFGALWSGAFGDPYAVGETFTRAAPLVFTGLGVALAFRCGVWNIGAEGQFLAGALAAGAALKVGHPTTWLSAPLLLLAAALAGGAWAAIPAWLLLRRRVPEVISTIMLNFIALLLLGWSIRGPLQEVARRYPQSDEVPAAMQLPRLLPPTRVHLGILLAAVAVVGMELFLARTVLGFQIRATGQNPRAARGAGIPTAKVRMIAMSAGGAIAGLGGGVELLGTTFRIFEPFSPGYGYTAIAVALVGGLRPFGVALGALLFGALDAGAGALQQIAGVPSALVSVIQALVLCFVAWNNARKE